MYPQLTVQQPLAAMLHLSAAYWQTVFELQSRALDAWAGHGRDMIGAGLDAVEDAAEELDALQRDAEAVLSETGEAVLGPDPATSTPI